MARTMPGSPTKAEVEIAINKAMGKLGHDGFDRAAIAKPFIKQGLKKTTIYRWIQEILASGRPGAAIEAKVIKAVRARAKLMPDPVGPVVDKISEMIPPLATIEDVTNGDTIGVIRRIGAILSDMDLLVSHAKTEDGRVRNAKLLIAASREIRQSLDSAVKLRDAMRQDRDIDAMMRAVVAEIAKESPECAMRIARRVTGALTLQGV